MDRTPVQSSNLAAIGYENEVLEIEFKNGVVYAYSDFPAEEWEALNSAPSVGGFFSAFIRGKYTGVRV